MGGVGLCSLCNLQFWMVFIANFWVHLIGLHFGITRYYRLTLIIRSLVIDCIRELSSDLSKIFFFFIGTKFRTL